MLKEILCKQNKKIIKLGLLYFIYPCNSFFYKFKKLLTGLLSKSCDCSCCCRLDCDPEVDTLPPPPLNRGSKGLRNAAAAACVDVSWPFFWLNNDNECARLGIYFHTTPNSNAKKKTFQTKR